MKGRESSRHGRPCFVLARGGLVELSWIELSRFLKMFLHRFLIDFLSFHSVHNSDLLEHPQGAEGLHSGTLLR